MFGKSRRRTVYLATIVAALALVSGFAMATLVNTITSGNQNGYNVTAPGDTIYAGGSHVTNLPYQTASACTLIGGSTVSPASGTTTADVYISGEVTCQAATPDWFEEVTFNSTVVPVTGPSDVFSITVGSNTPISVTVTFSGLTVGTSIVSTSIFYELGPSGTAVTSDIGITGT